MKHMFYKDQYNINVSPVILTGTFNMFYKDQYNINMSHMMLMGDLHNEAHVTCFITLMFPL